MSINFNSEKKVFFLNTVNSTYEIGVSELGFLHHLYYGKSVGTEDLSYLNQYVDRAFSGIPYDANSDRTYSMDIMPMEFPTWGNGDFRSNCLQIINKDGSNSVDLRYDSYEICKGKYKLSGLPSMYGEDGEWDTLKIILKDKVTNIEVELLYGVFEERDIITRSAIIKNNGEDQVVVDKALSACLDMRESNFDLISFYGRHAMEREVERTPLRRGKITIESIRGNSSHQQNPFVILCDKSTNEDYGNAYGMSLLYSGNFISETEVDQVGQTRVNIGIHPNLFSYTLNIKEQLVLPEVALSFSCEGLAKLSHNYHKAYRNNLCRGKYKNTRRPILVNNWEATYMDFDSEKLISIAKDAAELGVEMLVMDDGWFGKRDDDNSGLGDWVVNTGKLKTSLKELSQEIHKLSIKFGIWFEPEAVSEDSDLYRNHPDWCFKIPNRQPIRSRYQLVLDYSREEVVDYIYKSMCDILDSAQIEYVKWDMNRSLSDVWSSGLPANRQGEVYHKYILGVYDVLERLMNRYPDLLIEGCSGGGGRFDAGMLYYTPQIWCSDNTDAIDRVKIQYGTSFGYPISCVGSHVSACPNHQTGRTTPLTTRGVVAMAGTFGYELDLNKMTVEEKEIVKEQIQQYKEQYDVINGGEYYRLTNPYETTRYIEWQFVSDDKLKSFVSFVLLEGSANNALINVKLKGLKEDCLYSVKMPNMKEIKQLGKALMYGGVPISYNIREYESISIVVKQL